jgi:alpha-amylase/alpha-mannosidase (GH57 family)
MMERFLCIHGHFYQPPRENPWLEAVEIQDTAYPYHDWNERITAECYATNTASRILDGNGRIEDIVSNFAKISFNMGPTLFSWLEKNAPDIYGSILEADRLSQEWRSGHGAAIAQPYNHMIMPLANPKDKETQTVWGIRDFERRFGRLPEGMWLPETAVDIETLEVLSSLGIKFTILAPHQAKSIRPIGEENWVDVSESRVDPSRAYSCPLPSGRQIALFFYDAPISHAVAFEEILKSGEAFAKRLIEGFSGEREEPQIVHIATDGESYGHHHKFGDMALAYALNYVERNKLARITNYGEYLDMHSPQYEAEIFENTSWSCSHGVERWRADCGCSPGIHRHWNQKWRKPLRETLDWLRDELAMRYTQKAPEYLKDPWAARDDYIDVILDRSEKSADAFIDKHAAHPLGPSEKVFAIKLLETQRHAMLMFTSCGWFFEDVSGIETVQVLQYAGRAVQLAKEVFRHSLERDFLRRIEKAESNIPENENGRAIYEKRVRPCIVDLQKVGAHFAISSLFEEYPEEAWIYCYSIKVDDYRKSQAGEMELVSGRCRIASEITGEFEDLVIGVLHLGKHDFNCGVRRYAGEKSYNRITGEMTEAFEEGAFADIVRLTDKHFGVYRYSLQDLFKEEQRKILETILAETMNSFEDSYRKMYEDNRILMGYLQDSGIPITKAFLTAADFTLNLDLKRQLMDRPDPDRVKEILEEIRKWKVSPNAVDLEFTFRRTLEQEIKKLLENPSDMELLEDVEKYTDIALGLPFRIDLWTTQNAYYTLAKSIYPDIDSRAEESEAALQWVQRFRSIGQKIDFNLDSVLGVESQK